MSSCLVQFCEVLIENYSLQKFKSTCQWSSFYCVVQFLASKVKQFRDLIKRIQMTLFGSEVLHCFISS